MIAKVAREPPPPIGDRIQSLEKDMRMNKKKLEVQKSKRWKELGRLQEESS